MDATKTMAEGWVGSYDEGHGIAVDSAGNCYVAGYFNGTATFGDTSLTSSGNGDVFVAKYDSTANVIWVKQAGGADEDRGNGIAVDGMGNCYVTGFFNSGTATFGGTNLTSGGGFNIFVTKYDTDGNVLWARRAGAGEGNATAVDGAGDCYVTGDDAGLGGGVVFVFKYASQGSLLWAKQVGGRQGTIAIYDYGHGIAVDDAGNCYVTGSFQGTATFGGTNLTSNGVWSDIFVAKFSGAGNVVWARQAGGGEPDSATGIAVDAAGNCYLTGYFQGTATFGATTLISEGSQAFFVAEYDNGGEVVWAKQTGGTGWGFGHGIALDGLGRSYMVGECGGTTTFGNTTLASSGLQDSDVFVAMLPVETADLLVAVEAPPTAGIVYTNVNRVIVTLHSDVPEGQLFYTLDGSLPTPASSAYTGFFALSNSVTLRAVAYNPADFTSVESGPITITIIRGHYLTLLPPVQGGTVGAQPPGDFFTSGTQVQLTAKPDAGWAFGHWLADVQGSTNPLTLVMDRDWRVGAEFTSPPTFSLTVQIVGGGSVSGDPPGAYSPATIVNLVAQPDIGWLFLGWSGDASGTSTNLSLLMNRDQTVIADFQPIALMATTAGGGSIKGNTQPLYPKGTIVVLTALPDPGWQFLGWMGDSQGTNSTLSVIMNGPREVQAGFGTSLNVTNAGCGIIIRSSALDPIPWGGAVHLTAIPEVGSFFALWGNAARGTINPLDFVVTNANQTVAALFLPLGTNQVTLTALADGFGYIVESPEANVYTNGHTVTLTATPAPGQQFLDWSGALSGSQNPVSLTLDSSQTVTARFTRRLALSAQATVLWNRSAGVRVTVSGEIGANYEVQSSTDWTNWSGFEALSPFPGEAQFIDSTAPNTPSRFFRAIQLP